MREKRTNKTDQRFNLRQHLFAFGVGHLVVLARTTAHDKDGDDGGDEQADDDNDADDDRDNGRRRQAARRRRRVLRQTTHNRQRRLDPAPLQTDTRTGSLVSFDVPLVAVVAPPVVAPSVVAPLVGVGVPPLTVETVVTVGGT